MLPALADQAGASKSEVSRQTIEAPTGVLQELSERDLSERDVLVVHGGYCQARYRLTRVHPRTRGVGAGMPGAAHQVSGASPRARG